MLVGVVSDTRGYLPQNSPSYCGAFSTSCTPATSATPASFSSCPLSPRLPRCGVTTTGRALLPFTQRRRRCNWTVAIFFLTHQVKVPRNLTDPAMEGYEQAGVDVVVFGHSHIALQRQLGKVLFFNPGAAGKRRFKVVPSIGILKFEKDRIEGTIVPL